VSATGTARAIRLGGSRNARHMGGYPAGDGRVTRADRLYRSGWFELETNRDRLDFADLGIRQVVDFRTAEERARRPLHSLAGAELIEAPIASGYMKKYLGTVVGIAPERLDCRSAMTRMYFQMLDTGGPQFATMFEAFTRGEGGAMMICSAGKDRTGVGSALLLTALGVAKQDAFADFVVSADAYRGAEEEFARRHGYERFGHDLTRFNDVFTVYPEYLEAVWRRAEEIAGSVERLVTELAGGEQALARLRGRFTTTPRSTKERA
jgi:protein-tyrosine phosphatase